MVIKKKKSQWSTISMEQRATNYQSINESMESQKWKINSPLWFFNGFLLFVETKSMNHSHFICEFVKISRFLLVRAVACDIGVDNHLFFIWREHWLMIELVDCWNSRSIQTYPNNNWTKWANQHWLVSQQQSSPQYDKLNHANLCTDESINKSMNINEHHRVFEWLC